MNLYDKLVEYSNNKYYPMHMPGHKRNIDLLQMVNPYSIDITEIDGFDNLHHAEEILQEGMKRAARLYGSEHTNYLIGGSTAGILVGIAACTNKGDKILVARNCHKSVYNAIYLNELEPIYIYPQMDENFGINGGLIPENIEKLLIKHKNIKLIVITSPTYEGVISDVKTISTIAHNYGIPLLVDEAHGAHLGFHTEFPAGSVSLGADVVIHSLHKTLPSFTQTGLIHVNGKLVDYEQIKRYLSIYQSSSPSYLLMASIEQCISLLEQHREDLFNIFHTRLQLFYKRINSMKKIKVLTPEKAKQYGFFDFDPSKIIASVKGTSYSGTELYHLLLEKYKLQMEMVSKDFVLGMTSICDSQEGFQRFENALTEIDNMLEKDADELGIANPNDGEPIVPSIMNENYDTRIVGKTRNQVLPEMVLQVYQAYKYEQEVIPLSEGPDRVTGEYIYLYPPGIPLLVPGEKISIKMLSDIEDYKNSGLTLQGLQGRDGNLIKVLCNTFLTEQL